ncbi:DNA-dependent metalloprotease SPRTN [Poeciliopsis prolifica]|uniref:DNA-dependent metalloprotease SPRTN n=1 Tax=Poeciliopsis prolifica TaxID=188132 RepID=UPI0024138A36|nr:DNA-dependent metalloprotease SPRTN [Poeciliopsis prolifica]
MDADFLLAIQLQEQFDTEYQTSQIPPGSFLDNDFGHSNKKQKVEPLGGSGAVTRWNPPTAQPEKPLSIVDESWEMLDPNPDLRSMFLEFNHTFFWGKLNGVEVKWSPRMTLCAGVCSYEGRGGLCSIRLSEPLLKLRPRKDLVETLLHEMIHALLFVTQNDRDRDGHGPEFCKHMNRINKASGTKITIYHSFHDEVDVYRQHWWRCNGPCQDRKPYFGYVKRAMNRAPSSLDPWWEDHRRSCGGTYTKVKEPEGYGKKNKKTSEKKTAGNGKLSETVKASGSQDIRNVIPFSGRGFLLGGKSQISSSSSPSRSPSVPSSSSCISSPVRLSDQTDSISNARPSFGVKPSAKRSVGNTRVFVNVNGSPVKLPKSQGERMKQASIQDLFSSATIKTSGETTETSPSATSNSSLQLSPLKPAAPEGGAATPAQSKYFSNSGLQNGGQASRKRSRDDQSSSARIFDFFEKTLSSSSAAAREPGKTQTASVATSTSLHSGSSSSSSSSSSSGMMVSCPVCQAKIQEQKINEHLDSCLS